LSKKAKKSSNPAANTEKIPLTPNTFQILDVEESSSGNDQNSKEANHQTFQLLEVKFRETVQ
jgi:hypothetical protein